MNLSNLFLSKDFKKKEKKRKNYSFGYIDCTDQLDTVRSESHVHSLKQI